MATNLTQSWIQHAFPDDHPAKEQLWSENSERRRVQDRHDLNLEQSGSDLKIRRFTGERQDELNGKGGSRRAGDDMMMLAVGSPAYIQAYNHRLTFTVGGDDVEITQGELHELARRRAEDLQRQIDGAKRRGASADEIGRMQAVLDQVAVVRDNADPALGTMDEDRHRRVQDALNHPDHDPTLRAHITTRGAFGRDPANEKTQAADTSEQVQHDAAVNGVIDGWARASGRTATFAGTIDHAAESGGDASLRAKFVAMAENAPAADTPEDRPAPVDPHRATGLDI